MLALGLFSHARAADTGDGRGRDETPTVLPPVGAAGSGALPSTTLPESRSVPGTQVTPGQPGDAIDTTVGMATLPCDVATVVANRCQHCHGQNLIGGAPMPLVRHEDFTRDQLVKTTKGLIGQTMKAYALVQQAATERR